MTRDRPRIALSVGDPAGIGPDIVLRALQRPWSADLVVIADNAMVEARGRRFGLSLPGGTEVVHEALDAPVTAGQGDAKHAGGVLRALERAATGCLQGEFDAMVTAPVNKAIIAESGTPFSGHTEYLAELTGAKQVVMLLAAKTLRVALVTTHIPLARVPRAVTETPLLPILRTLSDDLKSKFGIESPRISVLGLNPHAGESGLLGHEDTRVIAPVIEAARSEGINATGPWPADTAFNQKLQQTTDAYLAMYHDQGLPVLKYASFGAAVNVTLGLPIIRTSVDHGTAYDLAGKTTGEADGSASADDLTRPAADSGSLEAAIEMAIELVKRKATS